MDSHLRFTSLSGRAFVIREDKLLGSGRYGRVFLGFEEGETEPFAIKCVRIDTSSATRFVIDGTLVDRELDVMRRLTASNATHVVPLVDFAHVSDAGGDELRLVMPLADRSLEQQVAENGPLDEQEARLLLKALSAGMTQMHSVGILHRDIKPRNVLRLHDRWVLSDLGIAKDGHLGDASITWEGTGTTNYWSPELFRGSKTSPQSDMFASGVTVVEAMTAKTLFPGPDHENQRLSFDVRVCGITDPALLRLVSRLLAIDPANRPRDAEEAVQLLSAKGSPATVARARFESLLGLHVEENRQRDELRFAELRRQDLRRSSLGELRSIWNFLLVEAQALDPSIAETNQDDLEVFARTLTVGPDRLHVDVRPPSDDATAVLVGDVRYGPRVSRSTRCVANIFCTESTAGSGLSWRLARFSHNHAHSPARVDTRGLKSEGVGLGLLEEHLAKKQEGLGAPPLFEESEPLTSDALLLAFVDAAEQARSR